MEEGFYPAQICKKLGVSKQNLNRRIRELKKQKVIKKLAYGVWEVTQKNKRSFVEKNITVTKLKKHEKTSVEKIRGHGYQFTLNLPFKLSEYERKTFLKKNKIEFKINDRKTWKSYSFIFKEWRIWLSNKSIICFFPKNKSIYGTDAEDVLDEAIFRWLENVIKPLQSLFGKRLGRKEGYSFKIGAQHHALVNSLMAKKLYAEGKRFNIVGKDGKVWWITDMSHNIDEEEGIHAQTSATDTNKVHRMYNSVKETGMTFHDVIQGFDKTNKIINGLAEANQDYAENIKSHVKAMQKLGEGIEILNKKLGQMQNKSEDVVNQIVNSITSIADLINYDYLIKNLTDDDKRRLSDEIMNKFNAH